MNTPREVMTPTPLFAAGQIAAINAVADDLLAKMLALGNAINTAFVPLVEKMSTAIHSMQEKP
jgi:hypothetical protein